MYVCMYVCMYGLVRNRRSPLLNTQWATVMPESFDLF